MKYPKYVKVENKLYKINTDFRYAIKCNEIAEDNSICDYERALGILYTLFGEDGINTPEHYEKLLELAQKYLLCGEEYQGTNKKPDMNFIQDENVIASSFKYDYKYNPYEMKYLHWYEFHNDLINLSDSEFGSCCALSRLRNFRNINPNDIKDEKQRNEVIEGQKRVALKKNIKPKEFTSEEMANMEAFRNQFRKE